MEDIKEKKDETVVDKTESVPVTEQVQTPTKRDQLRSLLTDEIPGYNADDDESSAEMLMGYINGNKEQRNKLAEALQEDPRLAQMLADIVNKKRGAGNAMARYFGKDLLTAEEGTPEYDDILAAEEERKQEMEAMEASKKEYNDNLEKSMPIVEGWCQEKGYDIEEFLDKVWTNVISPIMSGSYSREICDFLDKGLNYDKDTQDALDAGVVKGRNENINKLKEEHGDGLPKGITSTVPVHSKEKKKRSPLIEEALQA